MSEAVAPSNQEANDFRPVVRTAGGGNLGVWAFALVLLVSGLLIFQALNSRRQELDQSAIAPGPDSGMIAAPPPLSLPSYGEPYVDKLSSGLAPARVPVVRPAIAAAPQVITRYVERPAALPSAITTPPPYVFPAPQPVTIAVPTTPAAAPATADNERVTASRLVNPSLTVPKGTIIAAVLETALDSTRPGAVRAIVSRDVKSFDGSRVLIPRGSRLYGEYAADVTSGQKRALVRWQRLTRPDGVIINLDSPAADPLGRAGVEGKVDSHFFARFGSAILQSVLDIGVGLATRSVSDDTVIVGLPGSTQQVTNQQQAAQVQPTLRVQQGTSVSVFVARDLDFSTVDR